MSLDRLIAHGIAFGAICGSLGYLAVREGLLALRRLAR